MLAKVRSEPLLKLLPAPITLEFFLSSPAITREFMNLLDGSFQAKVSVFLLKPAAYRLHPKCKGMGGILIPQTLAISSQHTTFDAATSFIQGMRGASQQEEIRSWLNWDIQRCGLNEAICSSHPGIEGITANS